MSRARPPARSRRAVGLGQLCHSPGVGSGFLLGCWKVKLALFTPGWPRAEFANGIVSATHELVGPLKALGLQIDVLAWYGAGDFESVTFIPPENGRGLLGRARNKFEWLLDKER